MKIENKKAVVLGIGRSGVASAILLKKHNCEVTISDIKEDISEEYTGLLNKNKIKIEKGGHSDDAVLGADIIVISPGVPLTLPVLSKARANNIPVIGEIELSYQYFNAPIIAITGTKGKTTTSYLMAEVLKKDGKAAHLLGNMGMPLSEKADMIKETEIVVLEISSFQLESIVDFKPKVSAILNVTSDHMDRYKNEQEYVESKGRILKNQNESDFTILNMDNRYTPLFKAMAKSKIINFSSKQKLNDGVWLENNSIVTNLFGNEKKAVCSISDIYIKGPHNVENAMAVIAMSSVFNVKTDSIVDVLGSFKGVEHRQEFVADINGIKFINNSQGTNIDAVTKSILSYDGPVILIAGGRNKGSDFSKLKEIVSQKVKLLVAIGESQDDLKNALSDSTRVIKAYTLEEAVKIAFENAQSGDYILLSPACASFDMFKDYKDRGNTFKKIVFSLAKK